MLGCTLMDRRVRTLMGNWVEFTVIVTLIHASGREVVGEGIINFSVLFTLWMEGFMLYFRPVGNQNQ